MNFIYLLEELLKELPWLSLGIAKWYSLKNSLGNETGTAKRDSSGVPQAIPGNGLRNCFCNSYLISGGPEGSSK